MSEPRPEEVRMGTRARMVVAEVMTAGRRACPGHALIALLTLPLVPGLLL